ncbi:hypothetical protein PI124_g16903 [Phytophthora idaei]|nr:hypothetical protein PI125_g12327 [Phytophthora idaei]KAG3140494.1 hypothetical protein PI126_g15973 [Phytophthora idaei]KAG3238124.1 hypothetical protein PI124_g16903 [Phytophthora idaei]
MGMDERELAVDNWPDYFLLDECVGVLRFFVDAFTRFFVAGTECPRPLLPFGGEGVTELADVLATAEVLSLGEKPL